MPEKNTHPVPLKVFLSQSRPDQAYWCYPLLPKGGTMIIGAQPKVGKSTVALNIAYDLAEGLPLLSCDYFKVETQCKVLYIDQEVGEHAMRERMKRLNATRPPINVLENLWIENKNRALKLDEPGGLALLESHVAHAKPDVIIYDPLTWFHSRSENDNTEMHKVTLAISEINKRHNTSAIVVHHNAKPNEFRSGTGMTSLRGGSVVAGDADTIMSISRPDPKRKNALHCEFELRHAGHPFDAPLNFEVDTESLALVRK